eukprot:3846305-Amphidinium_carterae.1
MSSSRFVQSRFKGSGRVQHGSENSKTNTPINISANHCPPVLFEPWVRCEVLSYDVRRHSNRNVNLNTSQHTMAIMDLHNGLVRGSFQPIAAKVYA